VGQGRGANAGGSEIEAICRRNSLYRTRILTARAITPSGGERARIGTLEEIDAVIEVTPGGPPPFHSAVERDKRA
jgi:hypothetical protein